LYNHRKIPTKGGISMEQELLIQAKDVARMLSISPITVRIWTHKGYLPVVKVRRAARYRLSDIQHIQREGLSGSDTKIGDNSKK
jgi:hypothetical protein